MWDLKKEQFQSLGLHSNPADAAEIFDAIWVNSQGIRAMELKCKQMSELLRLTVNNDAFRGQLLGAQTRCVIVRRRDRIKQAISLNCARCSGVYHTYDELEPCRPCIARNEDISAALQAICTSDIYLDECASQFRHVLTVWYEDVLADRCGFLREFAAFCDLAKDLSIAPAELVEPKLRPSFGVRKAELATAYRERLLQSYA